MNQEFYNAVKESVQMSQQRWVEWRHEMTGLLHCGSCLSLHKCWFVFEKAPVSPLHEKCHCTTVAIPASQVKAMLLQKVTIPSIIHTDRAIIQRAFYFYLFVETFRKCFYYVKKYGLRKIEMCFLHFSLIPFPSIFTFSQSMCPSGSRNW